MDGLAELERISQLPIRIIQDGQQERIKERLWDMVKKRNKEKYNAKQQVRTVKNDTTDMPQRARHTMTRAQKQRQRGESEAYRRRQQQAQQEKTTEDANAGSMPIWKQHIPDDAWRKTDTREIIIGTHLELKGNKARKHNDSKQETHNERQKEYRTC